MIKIVGPFVAMKRQELKMTAEEIRTQWHRKKDNSDDFYYPSDIRLQAEIAAQLAELNESLRRGTPKPDMGTPHQAGD